MTIVIVFNGSMFFIQPNPAVAHFGSSVDWLLYYDGYSAGRVRWTLRFGSGSPFQLATLSTTASPPPANVPRPSEGTIDAGLPISDGCYKYDVEIADEATGKVLGNDDPYLIIRP
jgi:hypothetical protein